MADERHGLLWVDSWISRTSYHVLILGETPRRYKVRLLENTPLARAHKRGAAGDVVYVPRYAVTIVRADEMPQASLADLAPVMLALLKQLLELYDGQRLAPPDDYTSYWREVRNLVDRAERAPWQT